jgi:DNA polymerase III subunit epsilon
MNILFFDTETTGFPDDRLPVEHDDQPYVVQLAAMLCRDDGDVLGSFSVIVNNGVPIPAKVTEIHGIDAPMALEFGVMPRTALGLFNHFSSRAGLFVAHNIKFDWHLMAIMQARGANAMPAHGNRFCTMETAAPVVNLPPSERMIAAGINKPKAPKLSEAVAFFFGEELDGAHDAMVDVNACARVFFKLKELGHVIL